MFQTVVSWMCHYILHTNLVSVSAGQLFPLVCVFPLWSSVGVWLWVLCWSIGGLRETLILWKIMTAKCSYPPVHEIQQFSACECASFDCMKRCYVQNYQCVYNYKPSRTTANCTYTHTLYQCFSTAARLILPGRERFPGICHFSFLSIFHE
jgi:hypothetical protein